MLLSGTEENCQYKSRRSRRALHLVRKKRWKDESAANQLSQWSLAVKLNGPNELLDWQVAFQTDPIWKVTGSLHFQSIPLLSRRSYVKINSLAFASLKYVRAGDHVCGSTTRFPVTCRFFQLNFPSRSYFLSSICKLIRLFSTLKKKQTEYNVR